MRRHVGVNRRQLLKLGFTAFAARVQAAGKGAQRREFVAPHMGTLWRLVFFENDEAKAKTARDAAWERLAQLNERLSDYREDSEVSRLGREMRLEQPSADLVAVLRASLQVAEETEGAFDITVGPLVKLWREARKTRRLPDPAALEAARAKVNWRAIRLGHDVVEISEPGVSLDLGGIAKGYAQDEVLTLLRTRFGLHSVLLDAGGGVAVSGPPVDAPAWQAGLANLPTSPHISDEAEAPPPVWLAHASVSTAGDANQYVEIEGVRYSHIVDPHTGLGLTRPIQASVIAASGLWSDAYDTAFCVLGEEKTRALLQKHPFPGSGSASVKDEAPPWLCTRLVTRSDTGQLRIWESKGFARFTKRPASIG